MSATLRPRRGSKGVQMSDYFQHDQDIQTKRCLKGCRACTIEDLSSALEATQSRLELIDTEFEMMRAKVRLGTDVFSEAIDRWLTPPGSTREDHDDEDDDDAS
ncbi:MAG: hypothetical protein ACI82F_004528 [Planctomycetota bacterium]|jgi:hypothetical protein